MPLDSLRRLHETMWASLKTDIIPRSVADEARLNAADSRSGRCSTGGHGSERCRVAFAVLVVASGQGAALPSVLPLAARPSQLLLPPPLPTIRELIDDINRWPRPY